MTEETEVNNTETDKSDWTHVFVYGTLKKGGRLHGHLNNSLSEFVGVADLDAGYSLYIPTKESGGWYPMVTKEYTRIKCVGEVYLVHPTVLATLDRVEGCPMLYTREVVEVTTTGGNKIDVETYVYARKVPEGMKKAAMFNVS